MANEREPPGCLFWMLWVLASALAGGLGWAAGWRISFLAPPELSTAVIGLLMGAMIGLLQGLVLKGWFRGSLHWIWLTTVGWGLGFPAGVSISYVGGFAEAIFGGTVGLSVGLLAGLLQWGFLRRRVSGAGWWLPASALAWGLSLLLYRPGVSAIGLVYGLISSILTGWALVSLSRRAHRG